MRNIERLLSNVCFGASIVAGVAHLPQGLLITPLCFASVLYAENRAVRQRIGPRAWPSEAYARFLFGTNLYRGVRNTLFSTALYLVAAGAGSILRG